VTISFSRRTLFYWVSWLVGWLVVLECIIYCFMGPSVASNALPNIWK